MSARLARDGRTVPVARPRAPNRDGHTSQVVSAAADEEEEMGGEHGRPRGLKRRGGGVE
jgi:hypothetical protein